MSKTKIWPGNLKISVLGVTGEYQSGKTLFVLSIDPENTKCYDFEKSSETYEDLGVERINVPEVMLENYPRGYGSRQVFEWWYNDIKSIEPGKYSVIVGDPISDIEDGLVDWVRSRHKEWGFKTEESFASTKGIFWNKVTSEWKRIIADLSSRCQTFAFTTHLKFLWRNERPTTQRIPKGKSTLAESSSLFLYMERDPNELCPSAIVSKSRLATTKVKNGEIHIIPILPPRLPEATPAKIREYILNPPDYRNLKEEEVGQEKQLNEADRLEMEIEIATNKRAAEEAALETAKTHQKIADARAIAIAKLRPGQPAETDKIEDESAKDEDQTSVEELEISEQEVPLYESLMSRFREDNLHIARLVYKILSDRGEDISGFQTPNHTVVYAKLLTDEEIRGIL